MSIVLEHSSREALILFILSTLESKFFFFFFFLWIHWQTCMCSLDLTFFLSLCTPSWHDSFSVPFWHNLLIFLTSSVFLLATVVCTFLRVFFSSSFSAKIVYWKQLSLCWLLLLWHACTQSIVLCSDPYESHCFLFLQPLQWKKCSECILMAHLAIKKKFLDILLLHCALDFSEVCSHYFFVTMETWDRLTEYGEIMDHQCITWEIL